jgi:hypothetical protein
MLYMKDKMSSRVHWATNGDFNLISPSMSFMKYADTITSNKWEGRGDVFKKSISVIYWRFLIQNLVF